MQIYRYGRWDGTQTVFGADQLLDAMSKDLLEHGDVGRALRELLRRGMKTPQGQQLRGLREMLEQLRSRRTQKLQQHNLDSMMDDLRRRLDDVLQTERQGIEKRVAEAREKLQAEGKEPSSDALMKLLEERARKSQEVLNNLPPGVGGKIKELQGYEFMDQEAARKFQELLEMLKRQMVQNMFQDARKALQSLTPQDMERLKEMLKGLNQMLRDQAEGQQPDFQGFMDQFGDMFGPNPPRSLEELLGQLAQQMAQMQSLMESLSGEQRQELNQLLESLLNAEALEQLRELAENLEGLMPMEEMRRQYPFMGDEPLSMEQAMELMGLLQDMDDLERKLREAVERGSMEGVDEDKLAEVLGQEARRDLEQLKRIARMLEEEGYLTRKGKRLELTPKAIRKIGQQALKEFYLRLRKDRLGGHDMSRHGSGGDHTGDTKTLEFGDPFDLDLLETIMNGLQRQGPGSPVELSPEDFQVRRREHLTQTATVLLLDQSRSMGLFGSFEAAKKASFALYFLIQSKFPRDALYLVGFSDYAIEIKGEDLIHTTWNAWVSGTNMHHALMLARKLLSRHKGNTRQHLHAGE
ncbi:MAG: VWA domain-containing protein [Chloroflexi bacterium]|nr:VWA domain-containing protein [Chloroflexota bacterium]